ncbi:hypothetical protein ACTXT7_007203 [Hymenolepis weldensis]
MSFQKESEDGTQPSAMEVEIEANLPSPLPEQNGTLKKILHSNGSNEASGDFLIMMIHTPGCAHESFFRLRHRLIVWMSSLDDTVDNGNK